MKKRGFTLVELLAAIVVLAIIATIAVPRLMNEVELARKGAAEKSAYGYIEAIDLHNMKPTGEDDYVLYANDAYKIDEIKVQYKGSKPTIGKINFDEDGIVIDGNLCIEDYWVEYKDEKAEAKERCSDIFRHFQIYITEGIDKVVYKSENENKYYETKDSKTVDYEIGEKIYYYAEPKEGYVYLECTKERPCSKVVDKNHFTYEPLAVKGYQVKFVGEHVTFGSSYIVVDTTKNIKMTPEEGYYFKSINCTNGYTTNLGTGVSYFAEQNVTVTNPGVKTGSICTVTMEKRKFNIEIDSSKPYDIVFGDTFETEVTAPRGYCFESMTCTNGYTNNLKVGNDSFGTQKVTISNNKKPIGTECTTKTKKCDYKVTFEGANVTVSNTNLTTTLNGSSTVTLTPASGYYFQEMTCTNGYTHDLQVGQDKYTEQTITIKNNDSILPTTCTVTMHARSYAATLNSKTCSTRVAKTCTRVSGYYSCCQNYTDGYYCDGPSGPCCPDPCGGQQCNCDGNGNCWPCATCCLGTTRYGSVCSSWGTCTNYENYDCSYYNNYDCSYYSCPNGGTLSGSTCVF